MTAPWIGLYLPGDLYSALQRALRFAKFLGRRFQILSFYFSWGSGRRLNLSGIREVLNSGLIPLITWEPWRRPHELAGGGRPEEQPDFSLKSILNGIYDDYIWNWALDLKGISAPFFFRLMHEMNGNWYPWCGKVNGNRPEEYIETWSYIRSIFTQAGNDRLIWVWSPYVHSVPDEPGNEIWRYYPGPQEVDWLALDGYNWGTSQKWSRWQSFEEVFLSGYENLSCLSSEKPFMIAEVGCAEKGGKKERWIEEAFAIMKRRFLRIRALVWFDVNKECDWRIESSFQSWLTFRRGLTDWAS